MSTSELSRPVKLKALKEEPYVVEADVAERAALATRFGLSELLHLRASLVLTPKDDSVIADGSMRASWLQPCAISGEDFAAEADETLHLRFVPERQYAPDEEVELETDDLDEIEYSGDSFDLGEAVAQSLGLAIDPYAEGPDADEARKRADIVSDEDAAPSGPLAEALSALKKS